MIATGIHGRCDTNCRHPRIVSDDRNSTAPATAHQLPAAAATATINEITPRYDATGTRNAGRRSTAPATMRRPTVTARTPNPIHASANDHQRHGSASTNPTTYARCPARNAASPGTNQESSPSRNTSPASDSTSATTNQRPHDGIDRVEGDRGADQGDERERLAPQLGRPMMRPAAPPVGDGEHRGRDQPHTGRRRHLRHCACGHHAGSARCRNTASSIVQRSRDGPSVHRRVAACERHRTADALPRPDQPGVRWVPPANWHVTLRFLGEAEATDVHARLAGVTLPAATAMFGPAVRRLGRSALVVPVAGLERLAAAVTAATADIGDPPGTRSFNGHLTLARLRPGRGDLPARRSTPSVR